MSSFPKNVIALKGVRELPRSAPRSVRTLTEAVILTRDAAQQWKVPPFQRPVRINSKVTELSESLKTNGGIMSGVLTVGILSGEKYIVDGQHRIEAFKLSGLPEVYAEIRMAYFDNMADMADDFVELNSKLVTMRPDDILRGLEPSTDSLRKLRDQCPFVGYDMIRRGEKAPILSMSMTLRCWFGSAGDAPSTSGTSAAQAAKMLTEEEAAKCAAFLELCFTAWGREPENGRLWGGLNLVMTMWMWRRLVIMSQTPSAKVTKIAPQQFQKCLMSLGASEEYVDWLVGRHVSERDRSPCYGRMRAIFATRIQSDTGKKAVLPAPAWAAHTGGRR